MKLTGDIEGIAELKKIGQERKEYLKYLITEAKTNTDFTALFTGSDASLRYKLTYVPQTGELLVEKLPS